MFVFSDPNPPVKGQNVTIAVSGTLDETVDAGTYQIDVSYAGIPVYSKNGSICDYAPCPQAAGAINLSKEIELPSIAPAGSYHAKIQGADSNSQPLFCVEVDLNIN